MFSGHYLPTINARRSIKGTKDEDLSPILFFCLENIKKLPL